MVQTIVGSEGREEEDGNQSWKTHMRLYGFDDSFGLRGMLFLSVRFVRTPATLLSWRILARSFELIIVHQYLIVGQAITDLHWCCTKINETTETDFKSHSVPGVAHTESSFCSVFVLI